MMHACRFDQDQLTVFQIEYIQVQCKLQRDLENRVKVTKILSYPVFFHHNYTNTPCFFWIHPLFHVIGCRQVLICPKFDILSAPVTLKMRSGSPNLTTCFLCSNDISIQVWLESTHRFTRLSKEKKLRKYKAYPDPTFHADVTHTKTVQK